MNAGTFHTDAGCPDLKTLEDFNLGNLPDDRISAVGDHLQDCPVCLELLERLDGATRDELVAHLRTQDQHQPPRPAADADPAVERLKARWDYLSPSVETVETAAGVERLKKLGPYEILETVGEGGMGKVVKARHTHLGKVMALKLLPPDRLRNATSMACFQQEMKAIGQLNHPNIVQAHHAEVKGVPYLAMEFIDGKDLATLVRERGPLDPPAACACIVQAALALQHAHEFGLVHRDIKPSNLMLTRDGKVKLLDLGLARLHSDAPEEQAPGVFMGTLDYVAPEQMLNCHGVDTRADLYSLGCTLYHLLAGHPPFSRHRPKEDKQRAHLLEPPPDIRREKPGVPAELASILLRLLSKNPRDRYQTPAALAAALQPFAGGSLAALLGGPGDGVAVGGGSAAPPRPPVPAAGRQSWLAVTCLLAFAVSVLVSAWLLLPPEPGRASLIRGFRLDQFRQDGGRFKQLGAVPNEEQPHTEGDEVRLLCEFGDPVYCYLIEFLPDGSDRPLSPEDGSRPERRIQLTFPAEGDARHPLKQPGVHAFAVVASREPLPPYKEWRQQNSHVAPPVWPLPPAQGFWDSGRGTGRPTVSGHATPRWAAESGPPPAFDALTEQLQRSPGVAAAQVVAFTVAEGPPAGADGPAP